MKLVDAYTVVEYSQLSTESLVDSAVKPVPNTTPLDPNHQMLEDMLGLSRNMPASFGASIAGTSSSASLRSLNDDIDDDEAQKKLEKLFDTFSCDIPKEERLDAPAPMTVELKEYQRIGVAWMSRMEEAYTKGGILSDEMGLGKVAARWRLVSSSSKTVQTIACVLANPRPLQKEDHKPGSRRRYCTLVVLPLSLMEQWRNELESLVKPEHRLRILQYHGDFMTTAEKKSFENNPEQFGRFDCKCTTTRDGFDLVVVLTTYTSLGNQFDFDKEKKRQYTMNTFEFDREARGVGPLFRFKWFRCILDEAHTIKNRISQMSVACSYIDAERRWCLTGTPVRS